MERVYCIEVEGDWFVIPLSIKEDFLLLIGF